MRVLWMSFFELRGPEIGRARGDSLTVGRFGCLVLGGLLGGAVCALCVAAPRSAAPQGVDAAALAVPARDWAVSAAENEIAIIEHQGSYLRYKQHLVDAKGDELRDVIETKDGTVARLIMRDNHPLTQEQDENERGRLNYLIDHPADFARHQKNEANGKKVATDLIKLMPDAMIYSYVAGQPQTPNPAGPEVVIDFEPNPKWKPPTMYSEGLTGLRGRVWIDAKTKEIVRIEGDIFHPVNWGWGMLAHIYPGGKVDLEQTAASGSRWNMTSFHEQVTVKALMVKTLSVHNEGQSFSFQALPEGMGYPDAIRLLLSTALPQ